MAGGEEFAFPLLRCRVVDLEDTQHGVRVAVGEGVQAGAEQHVLRNAACDCGGKEVFGVAAAGDEEGTQTDGVRALLLVGGGFGCAAKLIGVGAEDGDCEGIVEDERGSVEDLVSSPAEGDAEGGARGARLFHAA